MKSIKKIWDNLELYLCCALFAMMFVVLSVQVTMRYVFSEGLIWSEEFSKYCLQWLLYLSVSLATRRGEHIRLTAALAIWPARFRKFGVLLGEVIWLLLGLYVAIDGYYYVAGIFSQGQVGAGFKIPLGYVYLAIPVGFTLMCIRIVGTIIDILRQKQPDVHTVA